ncbi:hypothetical protein [Yinghuangia soli]|uniref:Uncharacterized protein n=1 Tax=Yinghuangia soli TaxID=2908204 RepID=A0AA41Q560_9ACTN|nr:hypothetical protein [Yinghuangia soli]MCF2531155.1 hypothetical protein [Yinghuangia soli]
MDAGQVARWFPLVARPRPTCPPLTTRIDEVCELARSAATAGGDALARAAATHNKAALIASDCGMPELARSLCWRQAEIFLRAQPLGAQQARCALEPLVNLARLRIRNGDGDDAYQLLDALARAVRARTAATIDSRRLSFHDLTATDQDHQTLCRWLWTVLLADGTRALAAAGRWHDAATHAAIFKGVGARLLDGRQVTILALAYDKQLDLAAALLEQSAITEPWEHAVQGLLHIFCQRMAGGTTQPNAQRMLYAAHTLLQEHAPATAVFRTRVALTALALSDAIDGPLTNQVRDALITAASNDAYTARDVLGHPHLHTALTADQRLNLATVCQAAGFDTRAIAVPFHNRLIAAVELAECHLRGLLGRGVEEDRQPNVATNSDTLAGNSTAGRRSTQPQSCELRLLCGRNQHHRCQRACEQERPQSDGSRPGPSSQEGADGQQCYPGSGKYEAEQQSPQS